MNFLVCGGHCVHPGIWLSPRRGLTAATIRWRHAARLDYWVLKLCPAIFLLAFGGDYDAVWVLKFLLQEWQAAWWTRTLPPSPSQGMAPLCGYGSTLQGREGSKFQNSFGLFRSGLAASENLAPKGHARAALRHLQCMWLHECNRKVLSCL
jgi:hypothetical protein